MGFLFGGEKKEKRILIFDIGSGSVGGAIVTIPSDGKKLPTILKTTRTQIVFHNELNMKTLFKDMLSALNFTVTSLHQQKMGTIDGIYCVMASPWYISETKVIKLEKEKPFVFKKRLVDQLIKSELPNFNELYLNKYRQIKSDSEIIEHHIMGVSLNGYLINHPLNRRAKSLEINTIISLSPKIYLDKIREVISKNFSHHNTEIQFSSFIVDSYLATRDKFSDLHSYLLLDISGYITDIGIISNGVLNSSLSFPFGKRTFFNYMCTKLEIELRDAEELFKLYSSNNMSNTYKKKVQPLFESIENSWGEAFRQCIDTLPRILVLPNTIFLTADNDIKGWFANVLRTEEHIQEMVEGHKCIVNTLEGPEFLNMCNIKEGTCDPFLMVEAIAIMKKIQN